MFYYRVIKNLLRASLVLYTRQLKKITEELKQNAEWYGVREVQWTVRSVSRRGSKLIVERICGRVWQNEHCDISRIIRNTRVDNKLINISGHTTHSRHVPGSRVNNKTRIPDVDREIA